jgi:hypothetical protein
MSEKIYELERKFLLRRMPESVESRKNVQHILQPYDYNSTDRARMLIDSETEDVKFYWTEKKPTEHDSDCICSEDEQEITVQEFCDYLKRATHYVMKDRITYIDDEGYTWCFDLFGTSMTLIAEVEVVVSEGENVEEELKYLKNVDIPKDVWDEVLLEVTDKIAFKSKNLAIELKDEEREQFIKDLLE